MKRAIVCGSIASLACLLACGPKSPGLVRGATLGDEVEAPGASAPAYTSESTAGAVLGESVRAASVARGVEAGAAREHQTFGGDRRLATLASWVGDRLGEGATLPPGEVTRFFARHLGLADPEPHLLLLGATDASTIEAAVSDSVATYASRQHYDAWGAVVLDRQGLTLVIVALSSRRYELRPVPRRLDEARPIAVRGSLAQGLERPSFVITTPDGRTERVPAGRGPEFQISVPTSQRGVHEVELLADGPGGSTVVADFPVYVGVDVPRSVRLARSSGNEAATADGVRDELVALLQAERQRAGLPPLVVHEPLGHVALAHSQDMAAHHFVAHRSPTTGEPADRVNAAGLPSGLVLENIGRGYSAREIHDGLMQSPGHRANILSRDATHVGIGVVVEEDGSRRAYLATQVFERMAAAIDEGAAPLALLEAINRARRARGAPPLESDANLTNAAARGAHDFFAEPTLDQQEVVDRASSSMRRFAIAYRRIGGVMAVVSTLDEAATLEPTFDRELRYVGIGVAQGNRPDVPPNSIAVVVLFAWPR